MAETNNKKVRISEKMEEQWFLKQDGCLYVGSQVTDIIFHSNLNVMLVFGQSNGLKVLDINSGVILQSTDELGGLTFFLLLLSRLVFPTLHKYPKL